MGNAGSRGRKKRDKTYVTKYKGEKSELKRIQNAIHEDSIGGIAGTVVGDEIFTASDDKTAVLYNFFDGTVVHRWTGHTKPVTRVCVTSDGNTFYTAGRDLRIFAWRRGSADPVGEATGHELTVSTIAVSSDDQTLCSGSRDYSVRVWDAATCKLRTFSKVSRNVITCVKFFKNEPCVVQTSEDLRLRVWDTRSMHTAVQTFHGFVNIPLSCDVSNCGNYVMTSSNGFEGSGCEVSLWDRRMEKTLFMMEGHSEAATACTIVPRDAVAAELPDFVGATSSKDGTVKLWDLSAGRELDSYTIGEPLASISIATGKRAPRFSLATGSVAGSVHLLSLPQLQSAIMIGSSDE